VGALTHDQILQTIPVDGQWITAQSIANRVRKSSSWVGYLLRKEILPQHPELESSPSNGYRYKRPDPP
jgi:hypothetical protein